MLIVIVEWSGATAIATTIITTKITINENIESKLKTLWDKIFKSNDQILCDESL
jgi:hypothetical protein